MPTRTKVERGWGELLRDGKKVYDVELSLTVKELWEGSHQMPTDRALAEIRLTPMSGLVIEDGRYTLRFAFDGKQREDPVRVQSGTLLAA